MKRKGIFYADKQHVNFSTTQFYEAYSDDVISKLMDLVDIGPEIYDYREMEKHRDEFRRVEFLFSNWGMPKVTITEIKEFFPSLKAVFYAGGLTDHFDVPFNVCGIKVFDAKAVHAIPVAEYTMAAIIMANKGAFSTREWLRNNDYVKARECALKYEGNFYSRIGILGVGNVGTYLIKLLKNFNLEILVYDPFVSDEKIRELGVMRAPLDEIFSMCNIVTNHMANNSTTYGLINHEYLSRLSDYSTFINTGCSDQINLDDLYHLVNENPTITVVLDPVQEVSDEIYRWAKFDNVFRTPIISGSSGNEIARMGEYLYEQCKAYVEVLVK